ncbi:MAG: thymidylate synthase [Candidatus Saccharimonadales bacterium]
MIERIENVGYVVYGKTLGETWLQMVETVLKNGKFELDENRGRFAVRNLRFASETTEVADELIDKYGDQEKINTMKKVVFESDIMVDFDITPSFRNGAKSYKKRLEEGKMIDFVVNRLAKIPESKKAVMVFPTYEDYEAVTNSPWNDYLPCITALQFRVAKRLGKNYLDLTLFMRSWDGFQKGAGDMIVVSMIGEIVRKQLQDKLAVHIAPGRLDGLVTDVHIYENTYEKAQQVVFDYLNQESPEIAEVLTIR